MHYTLEIEIDQPREKVAELFGNPEHLGCWQPGFVRMDPIEGEPEKTRLLYLNRGREVEMIETVTVDQLPDEFTAIYEAPGMQIEVSNRFEEVDSIRTRWISENDAQVSGFMMRLVTLVMPGCFRKESLTYMQNFKAFAETGADIRDASQEKDSHRELPSGH